MRVAILGRTRMLFNTIEALKSEGHEIVLIGTCKAAPEYDIREEDFLKIAESLKVPFFNNVGVNKEEIIDMLRSVNADVAVSMNWPTMIGKKACESFRYGILNAHPGDLPMYKGNACPNWAILKGENQYAISIHYMDPEKLDAGDIVCKKYYPIDDDTTITKIYEDMYLSIPELFCKALKKIEYGEQPISQDGLCLEPLRCYPRIPTDSFIDWNSSVREIKRTINASLTPFEGAFTYFGNYKLHLMDVEIEDFKESCYVYPGQVIKIDKGNGKVSIAASDGIVVINNIQIEGIRYKASEVLKSTRIRLNYCLEEEIYLLRREVEELKKIIKG